VLAAASDSGDGLADTVTRMVKTAEVVDPVTAQTDRLEASYRQLCAELQHRGYLAAVPAEENR
jgi:predicted deacylase